MSSSNQVLENRLIFGPDWSESSDPPPGLDIVICAFGITIAAVFWWYLHLALWGAI
jgi:hypothetical protein